MASPKKLSRLYRPAHPEGHGFKARRKFDYPGFKPSWKLRTMQPLAQPPPIAVTHPTLPSCSTTPSLPVSSRGKSTIERKADIHGIWNILLLNNTATLFYSVQTLTLWLLPYPEVYKKTSASWLHYWNTELPKMKRSPASGHKILC